MKAQHPGHGPDRGLFVTGTDTGVGKTVVAAAILRTWREMGVDAVPMKPVQTGCAGRGRRLVAPDLDSCLRVAGLRADPDEYALMAPYRYRPACSPHLAARLAGLFKTPKDEEPFTTAQMEGELLARLQTYGA